MELDSGSYVDAMKREVKVKAQMWAKGKIVAVLGDNIAELASRKYIIKFENDSVLDHTYPATSCYIAQFNTKSDVEDWRNSLKIGDQVDAFDKFNAWSTGTVVWVDVRDKD